MADPLNHARPPSPLPCPHSSAPREDLRVREEEPRCLDRVPRCEACGRFVRHLFNLARLRLCGDCFDLQYIEFGVGA